MTPKLTGIHHLTAITADAPRNRRFYEGTLGLRLVKKTVNQDDVSAYHLFYADGEASPGTDITFFDWPAPRERRGSNSVVRTGLRVSGEDALAWWRERLSEEGYAPSAIAERAGRLSVDVEDFEGQRLRLTADETGAAARTWERSPVPADRQIIGLGPITMSAPKLERTARLLTEALGMRDLGERRDADGAAAHVFAMGDDGGPGAELHVAVEPGLDFAQQGAGGVHHVAFRTPDADHLRAWTERLSGLGVRNSGEIDRHYFRSLYFREPSGVLFEIATDGPGFAVDEPADSLGERLALPPFLEHRRAEIEAGLKPL
ncbi:ring-cleaving dioxygenase [Methylopila turkensis]|uniref:Glyoxalase n=1 Tax=Methylopila turkensis TaxID=1437816 RepID=A0A9W6JS21_9HYPH|nr:ring-cleaving dioxygenase [Methylopila turkensis]GLK81005.1 glyoxalase [Methylopila turkensis]